MIGVENQQTSVNLSATVAQSYNVVFWLQSSPDVIIYIKQFYVCIGKNIQQKKLSLRASDNDLCTIYKP